MTGLDGLMREAVRDVDPPGLGPQAWAGAERLRRRRRAGVAAGAAVAVAATAVGVAAVLGLGDRAGRLPASSPAAPSSSASATYGLAPVWPAPLAADEPRLPLAGSALPARIDRPAAGGPEDAGPVERAVAVVARAEDGRPEEDQRWRLHVLDPRGRWHQVTGVVLEPVSDPEGNVGQPLRPGSISPDGTWVAVPQSTVVLLVRVADGMAFDVATGTNHNEAVSWTRDGRLVRVDGEGTSVLVDPLTQQVERIDPLDDVFAAAGDVALLRQDGHSVLVQRDGSYAVRAPAEDWWGSPLVRGELVARAYFAAGSLLGTGLAQTEGIAVVDANTGRTAALVEVADPAGPGSDRFKGCCPVAGWLGDRVVYVSSQRRLVAVDVRTGAAALVAELGWDLPGTGDAIALGPIG